MHRRFSSKSAGLSLVEGLLVLVSTFIVLSIIQREVVESRDRAARLNIEESVRNGDAAQVKRGLKTRIFVDMSVYEPWTDAEGKETILQSSLLSLAVKLQHPSVVDVLLEEGANVDGQVWGNARQPIFWGAYNSDAEMYDKLVGAGTDLSALVEGKTALAHTSAGHEGAAKFFEARGAE